MLLQLRILLMLLQLRILSRGSNWLQRRLPSTGSLCWGHGAFVSAQQSCVVAGCGAHANLAQMEVEALLRHVLFLQPWILISASVLVFSSVKWV